MSIKGPTQPGTGLLPVQGSDTFRAQGHDRYTAGWKFIETRSSQITLIRPVKTAFANTLPLGAELYYNGGGASDSRMYDFPALMSGRIQTVGRRYVGIFASYEITPLLKTTNYFVQNLHDRSRYFAPALTYSLRTSIDWTIGIQSFTGSADSE